MPLVPMKTMLIDARKNKYAVGAFEFWSLDSAMAVLEAAKKLSMPVILQAGRLEYEYAGGMKNLRKFAEMAVASIGASAALHLDHAEGLDEIEEAVACGFTSVMYDGSALPYEKNAELTARAAEIAKPYGVTVEAELGRLAGSEGGAQVSDAEASQTDPVQAALFVEQTEVDALAVAVGTAHGMYRFPPKLNLERLRQIAENVNIPLVLHGGSGTPDGDVQKAIKLGIAKVNICTEFIAAYGRAAAEATAAEGFRYSVPSLFGRMKSSGAMLAGEKIAFFCGRTL